MYISMYVRLSVCVYGECEVACIAYIYIYIYLFIYISKYTDVHERVFKFQLYSVIT